MVLAGAWEVCVHPVRQAPIDQQATSVIIAQRKQLISI
jgi:hypothetical protein